MIKGKILRISPLRKGLSEYLDDEQLHVLKKKLSVELKLLKFLSLFKVSDADCMAFARDDTGDYLFTESSARFYANKYGRLLYDEELVDIYLVKFDCDCGRGENIYCINENGLRLLGLKYDFEIGLNDIKKYLELTQYVVYRKEELLTQNLNVVGVYDNSFYYHIKYADRIDIYNEYVFYDEYKFTDSFNSFLEQHISYNDKYLVLISNSLRGKELKTNCTNVSPIILEKLYKIVHLRNNRNQKTIRPKLLVLGG